ncbi:cytochrome c [Stella humosa]|uniref:Cytochrome c n=1 Tax=Stella humosa TaxID=94 RepID=A0A3N1LIT8_9PROT|nr:cytochrome c family protein [Stella humosa]ROP91064.1 cytochrome c [Stella humosa]BBK34586.1 cytochrome c family protein [Stella humosa]
MSLESNKIAAAVLMAGVIAMTSGFIAGILVHPHALKESVYKVEGVESAAAAAPAAPAVLAPVAPLLASADVAAGEAQSKKCVACHTFNQGGPNRVGPNLWDIVGAKHAHAQGFAYSDAIKSKPGDWTYEDLNAFLASPRAYAPGTKMAFAGLPKAEDRAALIAYLRTLSGSPKPLP